MSATATMPLAANADPDALHQRLAHWNRRRLAVGRPHENWRSELREDAEMRLLEGEIVESMRAEVADRAAEAPTDPDAFIAWFDTLEQTGPGQNDPLFPWLAEKAPMEAMRWFVEQEVAGEAGFDDLVALTQVKMPVAAKLEMARNYWDEMGRGGQPGMHGPMLDRLARALHVQPKIETTVWPALALGNLLIAFATTRRYAYLATGALGAVELTAPWRAHLTAEGLKRLGVGKERHYYALHSTLDVKHSDDWNAEVFHPLVAADPSCARHLAEGALIRLRCGELCYDAYRAHLWGDGEAQAA